MSQAIRSVCVVQGPACRKTTNARCKTCKGAACQSCSRLTLKRGRLCRVCDTAPQMYADPQYADPQAS